MATAADQHVARGRARLAREEQPGNGRGPDRGHAAGAVGYWLDGQATGQPWLFDVAEIQAPIHIFHGDSDTMAPLPILRRTLAPAAHVMEERIYPGGMHFSPWVTRDRQAAMLAVIAG